MHAIPHCLSIKEIILRYSIYPGIFYDYEIKPPAQKTYLRIRSLAARDLFGASKVLSSAIALSRIKNGILDPECWFILRVFATARNYFQSTSPDIVSSFFHIISTFRGSLHQVQGPNSVFGLVLCNRGWQISNLGERYMPFLSIISLCWHAVCSAASISSFVLGKPAHDVHNFPWVFISHIKYCCGSNYQIFVSLQ